MVGDTQIDRPVELIAFTLENRDFCIDIMDVREIRSWTPTTPMPHAPDYLCGMVNLRGAVLPVIDLSRRLGFRETEPTARHAIIVVQVGTQIVGMLVESVSDILTVGQATIKPPPEVGSESASRFVKGVLPLDGRMLTLVATGDLLLDLAA